MPKQPQSEYHWTNLRSRPRDLSKRFPKDDQIKNIRGTRRRVNYDYSTAALKNNVMVVEGSSFKIEKPQKTKPYKSKNLLERRNAKEEAVSRRRSGANKENIGSMRRRRRTITKKDVESSGSEAEEELIDLAPEVLSLAKKFGATLKPANKIRKYREAVQTRSLSTFNNLVWPQDKKFASDKYEFGGMVMQEIDIPKEEREEFQFFKDHPDAVIIGNGDVMLVAKVEDNSADFDCFVLDDEKKCSFEGPFLISSILKSMLVDDETSDNMED